MKKIAAAVAVSLLACTAANTGFAAEGSVPTGVPHLDHVFVIMMENHSYTEVLGNPNTPFINKYAKEVNLATNYFAVAHPSLTNYLEINGGSNFGVLSDNSPNWNNTTCQPNLATGFVTNESVSTAVCPIAGTGTDAPTPAIDYTNETSGPPGDYNIDGHQSIPAASNISGKTIADQLAAHGLTWKSYQESLPLTGAAQVNNADGEYSNLTNFGAITPAQSPALSYSDVVALYAVKHNPFVYFQSGQTPEGIKNTVGFETLYTDLANGKVPNYSLVVPNQCHDQHGKGGAGAFCAGDPDDNNTQAGLNPALMMLGDIEVEKLVTAIHASPVWKKGNSAIVVVWDENDYYPGVINKVVLTVDTNYGFHRVESANRYNHFSLLKSIEAGFGLPCLNHACDANVAVMADLFGAGQ
jgi:hypothetical protein